MNKWFSSLFALLTVSSIQAQQAVETPKLVVSIVVDQLRGDYLQYFQSTFGERGLKRLMNGGLVYHSVDFGFQNLSEAASAACIYTGAYPYYNGITGDRKYDATKNQEVSIVADENFMGNYTSDRFSPLALQASTVGDELKLASQGRSKVYAVAPNPATAIVSAGRYANCAFWLDNVNGKWATTTYYKDSPLFMDNFNSSDAIGNHTENTWSQSFSHYIALPYAARTPGKPFAYRFVKSDKDRFKKIKQTSLINAEVSNAVDRFLDYGGFGRNNATDFLSITYYAGNYKLGDETEEYSYEIQDIYYRLDKEIEHVLDRIDNRIGLKNAIVVLSSTGYYDATQITSGDIKPFGEFFPNRCTSLLNMFLMATYGQGNWVSGYYDQQIYLNHALAEEKQVNWEELMHKAADFVSQFSGVQEVTTAGQWMVDDTGRSADFRRGMNKQLSGDIFIELQPGWTVINEQTPFQKNPIREKATLSPFIIFGETIRKEHIYRTIKVTEIAPTLSYILRIRPPNACKEMPLQEIIK